MTQAMNSDGAAIRESCMCHLTSNKRLSLPSIWSLPHTQTHTRERASERARVTINRQQTRCDDLYQHTVRCDVTHFVYSVQLTYSMKLPAT